MAESAPVRPVAVIDANVLIPRALRDLLLSLAHAKLFRPVWQDEILDEMRRNYIRLAIERRGATEAEATGEIAGAMAQMERAFPDAKAVTTLWVPLVGSMTCDAKDRHVLAVAVGAEATLVTDNISDFPPASVPARIFSTTAASGSRTVMEASPTRSPRRSGCDGLAASIRCA